MCIESSFIEVLNLGLINYQEAYSLQKEAHESLKEAKVSGKCGVEKIFLLQHNPVYTLGRHADKANILASPESLRKEGIDVIPIERGGDVTFHGPGQLVAYPIIDMEKHRLGVKAYVDLIEESVIRTIADYGIVGERVEGATGVWIDKGQPSERKICAIGVKCSKYVTMHGLALNVNTDLSYFNAINPCGFTDKGVTSMQMELRCKLDFDEVAEAWASKFISLLTNRSR